MGILFFIPILILILAGVSAYFISVKAHSGLLKVGNKYPKAISIGVFVLSFAIIGIVLLLLFLSSVSFQR